MIMDTRECEARRREVQVAVDLDRVAVETTRRNAALNELAKACTCLECHPSSSDADVLATTAADVPQAYDVVIANILRPALLDLAERLSGYVRPGGCLLLSGLLDAQVSLKSAVAIDEARNVRQHVRSAASQRQGRCCPGASPVLDAQDLRTRGCIGKGMWRCSFSAGRGRAASVQQTRLVRLDSRAGRRLGDDGGVQRRCDEDLITSSCDADNDKGPYSQSAYSRCSVSTPRHRARRPRHDLELKTSWSRQASARRTACRCC